MEHDDSMHLQLVCKFGGVMLASQLQYRKLSE